MNRVHARLAARSKAAKGFVSQPEPRTIGSFARGRQLVAGNCLFAGYLIEAPNGDIWDQRSPDTAYESELHGFAWLDDLAAVGDGRRAREPKAGFGAGSSALAAARGPGWTPDLTGRRLIRWINHAIFLLRGCEPAPAMPFFNRWRSRHGSCPDAGRAAAPGLPRFEALTGLIYAGMSLEGMEELAEPAIKALGARMRGPDRCTRRSADPQSGRIAGRVHAADMGRRALNEAGREPPIAHMEAIERIAPSLAHSASCRWRTGAFPRRRARVRRLARSCVGGQSGQNPTPDGLSMGYARVSAGRTSVIIDASRPPTGKASVNAHASTLAFELTSGRRPLIVNCGSGGSFGADWRRAGRATPSHSTLCLDGLSSARLAAAGNADSGRSIGGRAATRADRDFAAPRTVCVLKVGTMGMCRPMD